MLVKVNTTARDIAVGVKTHPQKCAFARAFKRAVKKAGWADVSVGTASATLYMSAYDIDKNAVKPLSCSINLKARDDDIAYRGKVYTFITAFDTGKEVQPFTVEIDVPSPDQVELQ